MQLGQRGERLRARAASRARASSALTNSPPLIPMRRWIFHTDRLIRPAAAPRARRSRAGRRCRSAFRRGRTGMRGCSGPREPPRHLRSITVRRDHGRKLGRPSAPTSRTSASVPRACSGSLGPPRTRRRARGSSARPRTSEAFASSAIRRATCGPARMRTLRGGGSARIWTASAAAAASTGRSVLRARSRSRPGSADGAPPVAVLSFADEEGARFNTPTFGSKALSGRLDLPAVLVRRDDGGVALGDAMRAAGVDPDGIGDAPGLARPARGLRRDPHRSDDGPGPRREPVGMVSSLAARTRLEVVLRGRPITPGPRPGRAARRAVGGGPADRRRRGPGRGRSFADGDDGADPGQAERADDDRGRGTAVDRRPRPGRVRGDRLPGGRGSTSSLASCRCGPGSRSSSPWPRAATRASSRLSCGRRSHGRARRSSATPCPSSCASPATTPASSPSGCRRRWCSSATRPASAIRRRSTSTWPTRRLPRGSPLARALQRRRCS